VTVAPGTPLTAGVGVSGVTGNGGSTTVYCYANGNQVFSWTTSSSGGTTFTWTPSSAGSFALYCSGTWSGTFANGTVSTPNIIVPVALQPTIISLSPTSAALGAPVTITGTTFGATQGTSTVKFNGTLATVTSWSATSIIAVVPSGATTGNVVVTASGVATNGVGFTVLATPTITTLSPSSTAVGASVTVTGTNFGATQGTSTVTFNGTSATISSWSATSIVVVVPSGATTGNIVVKVSGVASSGSAFTVLATPMITSLSPTSAAVGGSVTITGTNFGSTQGTGSVKFNGTSATISSWSATSIVAVVPTGATTGNVVVGAEGVASTGPTFTVLTTTTTTTVLTSSINPSVYSTAVILSATVTASVGAAPNGSVIFYDGATELGSETILNGNAALTEYALNVGSHTLTAAYQGSSTDAASTSTVLSQLVQSVPTTTTVTLSLATSYSGIPVIAGINVTDTVGSYPSGMVNCRATGTTETFSGPLASGSATWTISNLAIGSYSITCSYAGTTDYAGSTSAPVTETVGQPPSPSWTSVGNMSQPLFEQTATLLPSGSVLIAGGNNPAVGEGEEGAVAAAEVYVPSSTGIGAFNTAGSMLIPRFEHTATLLKTGQVLIAGGSNYTGDGILSEAELYTPSSGAFAASPVSLNYQRAGHTATALINGTVLIAGGSVSPAEIYTPEATVESTSGNNTTVPASFAVVGSTTIPRSWNTATLLQNGMVLLAGGKNSSNYSTASSELYNPATKTFTATGSMTTPRAFHAAVLLPSGMVLIVGGNDDSGNPTSSAELYNPATGTFSATGSMRTARYFPGAALLNSGKVLIYGGGVNNYNQSAAATAAAELYDPVAGTFSAAPGLDTARYFPTTTALANGNVLTTGGAGTGTTLASAELYSQNNTITSVINPKYLIMGITYAPPGPLSSISYTDTNLIGNTSTLTNTFSSQEGISMTVTSNAGVSGWNAGSVSGTASSSWTQTNSSANTVTTTGQTSNNWTTPGTASYFTPVDHDYDIIWLWINPTVVLTVDMSNPSAVPVWNGYGYDMADPANGMDIVGVPVGYLNGDLPSAEYQNILSRSWCVDMYWPNGDVPALTATDYAYILTADPFTNSNYSVVLGSGSGAPTTTDGRFTQAMNTNGTPESMYYLQENPQWESTYSETYANTTTQANTAQHSTNESWSITEQFNGSFFFASVTYKMTESGSITTTNQTQTSVTNTNTQSTIATIWGPTCTGTPCSPSYSGLAPAQPALFDVYQDNIYASFMFWGVN
jgi:hypothetical protein